MPFLDRHEAGRRLVERLRPFRGPEAVVLGLSHGGVPVAYEVAAALRLPLDVAVVRRLAPGPQRQAFGAVAESGVRVIDHELVRRALIDPAEQNRVERLAREAVRSDTARFRGGRDRLSMAGRTAVIVDDGVTTGATAKAACALARVRGAARVVFAVPVGACRPILELAGHADNVVCLETPALFHTLGQWYRHFDPVPAPLVCELLDRAAGRPAASPATPTPPR
ncbi:phosphoribosyltransferase [Nocardia sp. alder85J]|uniref:phosphoribosyltransferase n=1 Tax=Nocardia sp. alder85J TaxID=2862949 RepID=UPI001CD361AD|nr:phosphoribosyltransferase family protein [Nocardia sp. alder85J]MCX4093272.1 phosphoribosyltransferase family protein [Nocardia sp. alder85J]